jgi:inorganic pyrophosphatase
MRDLAALPHRLDPEQSICLAVVECPEGERGKFAYDPELGGFELKRLLPAGMAFPLNFGFVPSTKAEDGDPLDIMVIHDIPLPMGALTMVRLVGVIEAEQTENGQTVRNDRLVGVTASSLIFADVRSFDDLPRHFIETLTAFWTQYEALRGVGFKILRKRNASAACANVKRGARQAKG